MSEFIQTNPCHNEVFMNDEFILKTGAVSDISLENIKNNMADFSIEDLFLLKNCQLNAEVFAYEKLNKIATEDIKKFFPKFFGIKKTSDFDVRTSMDTHYISSCFLLERIHLKNEIKLYDLSLDSLLYGKIMEPINYLVDNNITKGANDCSILYNDDLSEIKIVDFFSVNLSWFDDYLRKNAHFTDKIREYLLSNDIYTIWNHDYNYLSSE